MDTGGLFELVGAAPSSVVDDNVRDLTGARLGVFEVIALIGRGGMGEVYRAHDTKLGRDVAIKALPTSFTADAGRLAGFERGNGVRALSGRIQASISGDGRCRPKEAWHLFGREAGASCSFSMPRTG
jgi:serine/threonine protein kinase